jgi:hypothetical protein
MKSFYKFLTITILIVIQSHEIFAQSDLEVFGFFQATLGKVKGNYGAVANVPKEIFGFDKLKLVEKEEDNLNPSIQQLNLLFRKEMSPNITAWVNLEILGNYNSSLKWGGISLQEAWANYQVSDAFNVKLGLLIPKFAYLNEIKNRFPLIPYITRPLIYESAIPTINIYDYIPERAFAQISGYFPVGDLTLDYAAFFGQSERTYIVGPDGGSVGGTSVDTTNFKLWGGRIGASYGDLRFGISGSYDKKNLQATLQEDVPRTRLAFDLGYSAFNFFFEGEYIAVMLDSKNTTEDQDKLFYYGTLGYNFTDDLYGYGTYSYMKDKGDDVLGTGMTGYILGLGYKLMDSVVLKASYTTYSIEEGSFPYVINPQLPPLDVNVQLDYKAYQLGVSILF